MRLMLAVLSFLVLAAGPAVAAGGCLPAKDGVQCTDGGETIILRGPNGTFGKLAGEKLMLQRDAQGNTFGIIGGEKLMIIRAQGMSIAKLGDRKLICAEAGAGVTICK